MFTSRDGRRDRHNNFQRHHGGGSNDDDDEDDDETVQFHSCYTHQIKNDGNENEATTRSTDSHLNHYSSARPPQRRRKQKVFPPLLHTNVRYTHGIRLTVIEVVKEDQEEVVSEAVKQIQEAQQVKRDDNLEIEGGKDDGTEDPSVIPTPTHLLVVVPENYCFPHVDPNYNPNRPSSALASSSIPFYYPPIQLTLSQSYLWSVPHMAQYIVSTAKRAAKLPRRPSYKNPKKANHKPSSAIKSVPTNGTVPVPSASTTSPTTIAPPYDPNHTFRFLGTITRKLYTTHCDGDDLDSLLSLVRDAKTQRPASLQQTYAHQRQTHPTCTTKHRNGTGLTKTALQSIDTTWQRRSEKRNIATGTTIINNNNDNDDEMDIDPDEDTIFQDEDHDWSDLWNANVTSVPSTTGYWNAQNGDLLSSMIGYDYDYIAVSELLQILQQVQLEDAQGRPRPVDVNTETYSYQNPNDPVCKFMSTIYELIFILKACRELSNPTELWNVPLLMVYPILIEESVPNQHCDGCDHINPKIATIQFGIYGHRLLMETYTTKSLHVLLNKLDSHSYHVTIPKCSLTTATNNTTTINAARDNHDTDQNDTSMEDPIFISSPYPVVVYNQKNENSTIPCQPQKSTTTTSHATLTTTATTATTRTSTNTTLSRGIDTDTKLQPPSSKKQKVICILDDDFEDDRKMPANPRRLSPSSTTVMELNEEQQLQQQASSASDRHNDTTTTTPFVVNTVSPFTPMGLLKILENEGCDPNQMIPNWYLYFMTHLQPLLTSATASVRLSLLPHQQYAIVWMYQMEHLPNFGINSFFWEEREFLDWYNVNDIDQTQNIITATNRISNKYYVNSALGQIRFEPPETMKGGLLCDEMGLGKTVEVLGLIVATIPELKRERDEYNKKEGHSNFKMTHATLIIVPTSLASQWENEIVKCTGTDLIVEVVDNLTGTVSRRTDVKGEADIVLTTYKALAQRSTTVILQNRRWGRIVLDEMQEIRTSTSIIAKSCEKLEGNRRWMLSGTPIFDGIDDLRGELNFLRLEPFSAASEDGFFDFMIKRPWIDQNIIAVETLKVLGKVILRRSKNMTIKSTGAAIMDLKPLTVEFVPVQQTKSERAIYYFLESILARIALSSKAIIQSGRQAELKRANASRKLCLRLLRDTCNAVVLLNGGIGAPSQLPALNNILIAEARKNARPLVLDVTDEMVSQPPTISCDEAILHLAQVQHAVRAGDDEVACLALGLGQGMAKRSHASDSVDVKYAEANEKIQKAKLELLVVTSERAKARWIKALEMVTMGQVSSSQTLRFKSTWTWRSLLCHLRYENDLSRLKPHALSRGWRPSPTLLSNWHKIHPEFYWAYPNTLKMENIPPFISKLELTDTICNVLIQLGMHKSKEAASQNVRLIVIENRNETSLWDAWLQFESKDDSNVILHKASSAHGIIVPNTKQNQKMLEVVELYRAICDKAQATCMTSPTEINHVNQERAAKALKLAQLGLRIVHTNKSHDKVTGTIRILPACDPYRTAVPRWYETMHGRLRDLIHDSTGKIYSLLETIQTEQITVDRLSNVLERENTVTDEAIRATSAFEKLNALANGNQHETHCCICLDYLGNNCHGCPETSATIAMIDCGHLYCRQCLVSCRSVCPTCRRPFNFATNVSYIDLTKTTVHDGLVLQRKEKEKQELRDAYQMLQENRIVMDPTLWDRLYYAIGIKDDSVLDVRVPALPRHFLGHVRECIKGCCPEIPVLCAPCIYPYMMVGSEPILSSKVKALLNDLPREERSVVFSTSTATIKHLEKVLEYFDIRCRSLFVGQNAASSERAVLEWQSISENGSDEPPFPVLLVQAGAAASGLTLTSASKMFLMEPFLRYSEELQAYGRCHRHGQSNAVYVKCYYVPMSMESQILERRKRAKEGTAAATSNDDDTTIKFSHLYGDDSDDDA